MRTSLRWCPGGSSETKKIKAQELKVILKRTAVCISSNTLYSPLAVVCPPAPPRWQHCPDERRRPIGRWVFHLLKVEIWHQTQLLSLPSLVWASCLSDQETGGTAMSFSVTAPLPLSVGFHFLHIIIINCPAWRILASAENKQNSRQCCSQTITRLRELMKQAAATVSSYCPRLQFFKWPLDDAPTSKKCESVGEWINPPLYL